MKYTKREKITIIAILIAIMEADGIIDPNEVEYLKKVIIDFELDEFELEQIVEIDFNLVIDEFKQFDKDKRLDCKGLFIGMAKSDGYADERELNIINHLFS